LGQPVPVAVRSSPGWMFSLSSTSTPSPGPDDSLEDEDGVSEDDEGVSVVVVVVTGVVVVVMTGGRVVTGGLVTGGFVTGGLVTGGLVVVVTGGGTTTRNAEPAVPHFVFDDVAVSLWLPAVVAAGTVAPTEPLALEAAVAIWVPSSANTIVTARHAMNPLQEMVTGPPAVAGCGAAVTTGGGAGVVVCAAAGVAASTVTPAAKAASKPNDRIPTPRIRT
jgi:hypothetical protein